MLPLINAKACGLLDHRRLTDQLINLERRTSFGSNRDTIGHPPGAHDDLANAVAGALLLATARRPRMRQGAIDFAVTSKVYWHDDDEEEERPRLRVVQVDEHGRKLTPEEAQAVRHGMKKAS